MADFALLVGVNAYPLTSYATLKGPPNDLALVREWLLSPTGGNVPAENIYVQGSPIPPPDTNPNFPPTESEIWGELKKMVFDANGGLNYRPDSRLYLYFSGHGFSSYTTNERHAALYVGNAAKRMSYNVCGTTMARWCERAGVFGEIVLVMDCCRDREVSKRAGEPHFDDIDDPARARDVKRFEIYAVPYGDKAQEREIPALGKVCGLLTYAWIQALKSAPARNGKRTANDIKEFIEGAWGTFVGDQRVEQPDFVTLGRGSIEFPLAAVQTAHGTIRFAPALAESAQLTILDDQTRPIRRIELDAGQQTHFDLVAGGAGSSSAFDGVSVAVALPVGVYKLTLQRAGKPDVSKLWTMLGDADVQLDV